MNEDSQYEEIEKVGHIFGALAAIKLAVNADGIAKEKKAKEGGGYNYRGIDDVQNFFSAPLAENNVMVIPSYTDIKRLTPPTEKGSQGKGIVVEVTGHFNFLSLKDGSSVTMGPFYGEAYDSLDKATSKATSVCYRNAMLLSFSVPLGPTMDPEFDRDAGDFAEGEPASDPIGEPRPRNEPEPPSGRKVKGEVMTPLNQGQEKILASLKKRTADAETHIRDRFGEVHAGNFNEVANWLKRGCPDD